MTINKVSSKTKINDLVTWMSRMFQAGETVELTASGKAITTMLSAVARFMRWQLPIEYETIVSYEHMEDDPRKIRPKLVIYCNCDSEAIRKFWEKYRAGKIHKKSFSEKMGL